MIALSFCANFEIAIDVCRKRRKAARDAHAQLERDHEFDYNDELLHLLFGPLKFIPMQSFHQIEYFKKVIQNKQSNQAKFNDKENFALAENVKVDL